MARKSRRASAEALSAKVDYQLLAPGAAKRVSQFVMPMMMGYGYMNTLSSMGGNAPPGMMQQTQEPMLSAVFSLVDRATGANKAQPILASEDGAAAAALQKEIDTVLATLKKPKG